MNDCQRAWFWKMGGSFNSIWLLLETEGAWFITTSNLSTVVSTDYIFLCFLSHIRFYAHGFILLLLQSLGRNYGLIILWTGKWMWLTEPYPILEFSSCSWRWSLSAFHLPQMSGKCAGGGAEAVTMKPLFSSSSGRSSSWIRHSVVPCKTYAVLVSHAVITPAIKLYPRWKPHLK